MDAESGPMGDQRIKEIQGLSVSSIVTKESSVCITPESHLLSVMREITIGNSVAVIVNHIFNCFCN